MSAIEFRSNRFRIVRTHCSKRLSTKPGEPWARCLPSALAYCLCIRRAISTSSTASNAVVRRKSRPTKVNATQARTNRCRAPCVSLGVRSSEVALSSRSPVEPCKVTSLSVAKCQATRLEGHGAVSVHAQLVRDCGTSEGQFAVWNTGRAPKSLFLLPDLSDQFAHSGHSAGVACEFRIGFERHIQGGTGIAAGCWSEAPLV